MARLLSGKWLAGSVSALNTSVRMPLTKSPGLNVGYDARASTEPSFGSSTTTEPAGATKSFLLPVLSNVLARP